MTGDLRAGADLVIYVDHSDIREGCIDELKEGVRSLVDVIEQLEPELIGYGFHFDEAAGRMTVTAVHPGSASLELHMEVGQEEFRKLSGMLTLTGIEVYGSISARARAMLEQKAAMLGGSAVTVRERHAGFVRAQRPVD
jgi:hypothetical protein